MGNSPRLAAARNEKQGNERVKPERWQQVKAVLAAALERAPDEREDYLNQVCDEEAMRSEVESLLAAHQQAGPDFLEVPSNETDALMPGTRLGPYEILSHLGEGGMGTVYKARDTRLDRFVAIKLLRADLADRPDLRERFVREARTIAGLNHPNICTLHDIGHEGNADYLVMEYLEGETLAERLERGPLPLDEVLRCATEIADALEKAHSQGVIHRDLKPGNVMLTAAGSKLLDFGLAKLRRDTGSLALFSAAPTDTISAPGEVLGTLSYMAPEQLESRGTDARTDIFAFGTVMYEMMTGKRAFAGESGASVIAAILKETPAPLDQSNPGAPADLQRIIAKMLAKEPSNRYASAADILADLRALQSLHGGPSRLGAIWRMMPRRALAAALGGVAIALAAILIFLSPQIRERFGGRMRAAPLPHNKLVAVLPFAVTSDDVKEKPFSDGLTETLTAKLTQLTVDPTLQVVPAPEVRGRGASTIDDIRKEFGATLVVEGNLQRSGDRVRINIALVDAGANRQLRAESLTVPASDPFALQDQVVNATVGMLQLEVQPGEREALEAHGTETASAYDFYLQGVGYLQDYDKKENIDNAIKVFNTALELDPRYAGAYAGRGEAYWKMYESGKDPQWIESSRHDCQHSLDLDKRLPSAHVCLGTVYKGTGHYEDAAAQFESAVASEPTDDDAYRGLADAYESLGKSADAEKTYRRAIELRPHYWAGYSWLGAFYYSHARYTEAASMFSQVIALTPDSIRGYNNLGTTYNSQGRYADAIGMLQHSISIRPTASAYSNLGNAYFYLHRYGEASGAYEEAVKLRRSDYLVWWNLADGYYWTPGKRAQALEAYRQAITLAMKGLQVDPRDAYKVGVIAYCHAMLGERKPAFTYLQTGLKLAPDDSEMRFQAALVYNQFDQTSLALNWLKSALALGLSVAVVRDTPNFDSLRSDPRFQELVEAR
jgi:serine/threonine protein kinase/Tfp pilus assembly protein PilF/TolB-like protein